MDNPDVRERRIKNTETLLDDARHTYMCAEGVEGREEAFVPIIDACWKLLAIAKDQQEQIDQLDKTVRSLSNAAV